MCFFGGIAYHIKSLYIYIHKNILSHMDMSPWCPQICKTSHNVIGKLLRSQSSPSMSPSFDGHVGEILPDSQASLDMGKYLYIPIEPMGLERYLQLFTGICRYSNRYL